MYFGRPCSRLSIVNNSHTAADGQPLIFIFVETLDILDNSERSLFEVIECDVHISAQIGLDAVVLIYLNF